MTFKDASKMDRDKHGWPVSTGATDKETGAPLWKLRLCIDASPQEILAYRKIKKGQADGIKSQGFPNDH
jgi:hypothetical protein